MEVEEWFVQPSVLNYGLAAVVRHRRHASCRGSFLVERVMHQHLHELVNACTKLVVVLGRTMVDVGTITVDLVLRVVLGRMMVVVGTKLLVKVVSEVEQVEVTHRQVS